MSLAKSAPTGMGLIGFPGGMVTLMFTLTATCPSCPTTPCAAPATPTAATATVSFFPGAAGPCPPLPPAGAPTFSFTTALALPACTPAGAFTSYTIVVPVPAATPLGVYCAYGTVSVTFSDGMTLSASGDTKVCIVQPLAGMPGVPRLSLTLLTPSAPRLAPGDMAIARYLVRNHDLSNAVTLTAIAGSRQSALRPQGGNERQGVFSISNPFGDDFPIMFNPGSNCIPLPRHPYTQPAISNALPTIAPGRSNIIVVGIRSYGQCANGSCSESTMTVTGRFSDGSPALACAGMALIVDTAANPTPCARAVNDCNQNGIPDALDIEAGRSQDRNNNAMPDECEEVVNVPVSVNITPPTSPPGGPLTVQVSFNEAVPMVNVWANGSPLTRMMVGGLPFWQGTIPADTRPGPQTVYFLGRDQQGGLATTVGPYIVQAPLVITQQPQNQVVPAGQSAVFNVVAVGSPPLSYQWRFNGTPIPGGTGSTLVIPNAQPANVGNYNVVVSNPSGSVTSAVATLTLAVPLPLFINEWLANADPPLTDSIELFNAGNTAANVSGYFLTDDLNNRMKFRIPTGTIIAPRGFLVFNAAQLGFTLATAGESIGLSSPSGALVDSVTFGPQTLNVSEGRYPDGAANIVSMPITLGATNRLSPAKQFVVLPTGQPFTNTLTEAEENAGAFLRGVIPNARWVQEEDWALIEPRYAGGPLVYSDLFLLRNEGANAVVIFISDADNGPPLVPPRPNPMLVPSTGLPLVFLNNLVLANGTNRTVKITVHSDGEMPIQGVFSDILTIQVCPPIPSQPKEADVPIGGPTGGPVVTGTLTESEEVVGTFLRCIIRNAQWEREEDWALVEPALAGGPIVYSDLFFLRNEGSNAVVVLISDSDAGPPLIPPRPFPTVIPSTGLPIPFLANLVLPSGATRTAKIIVHSDGEVPIQGQFSDILSVQVCPPIPRQPKITTVPPTGVVVTGTLTEQEETNGLFLKCIIPNARWEREQDWLLMEPPTLSAAPALSDIFALRNEGANAVVILISDSDVGPALLPPRPNATRIPSTGQPMLFLNDLLLGNGTNRTVKISVHSDGEALIQGQFSDILTVQVCPPIPPRPKLADVPITGEPVSATLTETEEVAGLYIKCVIRNAQWDREEDWVLTEPATFGPPAISDLFFLRNEGPDAAVILISDADGGPALQPPRPNYTAIPSTGLPIPFLAHLTLAGGSNRTAKIIVHSDGETPLPGGFSDRLTVQICPPIPPRPKLADVPITGEPVSATLTETEEVAGLYIKCVIRNAQWDREEDWVLTEPATFGPPAISDLFFLRNEGPDAAVILISDADGGPALQPPRPNYTTIPSTGLPIPFLANLTLASGAPRTVKILVHSDGETPLAGGFSDRLTVQVCPPIPGNPKIAEVPPNGTAVTGTLTEAEEAAGRFLKCIIRNAQWEQENDWVLFEPPVPGAPPGISDLFYLRNEGPDAAVILISDADGGPALVPPRPNFTPVASTGLPITFLANLLLANGTNRTVKIIVHSDGETLIQGQFSDVLTVQVCPPIPGIPKVADVPVTGEPVSATLTETEENAGLFIKCVIRNAQWDREMDWALIEPRPNLGPLFLSDLLLLRNEGRDAAVILISDADNGPALIAPRPNPTLVPSTGTPLLFLANLGLASGTNRTVKITVQSDGEQPLAGGLSDRLTVQVCPPIPSQPKVADVPVTGEPVSATLTEAEENSGAFIKCVIRNAQWDREQDWALIEPGVTGPMVYSDLFLLRNEGPDAAVILISDADNGPALIPPVPFPTLVPSTGQPMLFLADLRLANGTNRTVKMIVHSDSEQPVAGGFSDRLTVQVCPPIPPRPKVADVPLTGLSITNTLTEAEENVGTFLKCVIRNARWEREMEWALIEPATGALSDLFLLHNEGPDAVVILVSDADNGPALTLPNPNVIPIPATGLPMPFRADLLLPNGSNYTVKISVHSDSEAPIQGVFSDVLIVQVCPRFPGNFKVADVPVDGTVVTGTLTEQEETAGLALKCVVRNAQWDRELDVVLTETTAGLGVSDIFLLRNEGPDAAVILISDADNGPPLVPPVPNPMLIPSTGLPIPFQAGLRLLSGTNRLAKISVHSDAEQPIQGMFSDVLSVQICPVPVECGPLRITRDGNVVVVTWPGAGTLEVASNVTGPWSPLPTASPYRTPANMARCFFRLRCP